jgi:hypothetical protein
MKLEIARGVFLLAALGVATAAAAAWDQPRAGIIRADHGQGSCLIPRVLKSQVSAKPDKDFLLFMFSMGQGVRSTL